MISNELLEKVIYISNQEKLINENLIEEVALYIINQADSGTQNNFNGIDFSYRLKGQQLAYFDNETKVIGFDLQKIYLYLSNFLSSKLYSNLSILQILLHELEHVKEKSKLLENSLESKLINYSSLENIYKECALKFHFDLENKNDIKKFLIKVNKYYLSIWETIPNERLAEINSSKNLLYSIYNYPKFKTEYSDAFDFFNEYYQKSCYMGYSLKNMRSPIFTYISKIKKALKEENKYLEVLNYINYAKKGDYTLEEKLMYGLPVFKQKIKESKKHITKSYNL